MWASQPQLLNSPSSHSALSRSWGLPTWLGWEARRFSQPAISPGSTRASKRASTARSVAAASGVNPIMAPGAGGPGLEVDALSGLASSSARSPLKLLAGAVGWPVAEARGGVWAMAESPPSDAQAKRASRGRRMRTAPGDQQPSTLADAHAGGNRASARPKAAPAPASGPRRPGPGVPAQVSSGVSVAQQWAGCPPIAAVFG